MNGQTVLVTGAASGIGLGCTNMLIGRGDNVLAFDVQGDKLKSDLPSNAPQLATFAGDVSKDTDCADAVALAVERFGRLDALIHWGAIHSSATWEQLTGEEMSRVLAVNLTGSFLIAQAAGRHMVARGGGGSMVLTTSGSVVVGASGGQGQGGPAYVSSKGGVIALMRSLARGFGPHDVRVNAVSPGVTETPMIGKYTDAQREWSKSRSVLGRIGAPEDVAEAALFLISDAARFITGQTLHANGGASFS